MFVYFASGCKLWYELSVGSAANSREELCCFSGALLPPRAVNVEVHARGLLQPNNVSKGLYILVQSQCPPKGFSPESYLTSPARWVRDVARACNGIYRTGTALCDISLHFVSAGTFILHFKMYKAMSEASLKKESSSLVLLFNQQQVWRGKKGLNSRRRRQF